ncbi:MAG: HAD-IIIA family hydrolase [Candidatus Taylorbacteria bacterium]|nr:HAD-IIIA family hydrolase [Candidatus Taylorbacteria bacterium]
MLSNLNMRDIKKKAVFFDRDGIFLKVILRENGKYTPAYSIAEFKEKSGFIEGSLKIIEAAKVLGFIVILITNQPDVRYGKITQADFDWIQSQVDILPLDDVCMCLHGKDDGCECRKPKPGMLLTVAQKWNIDLSASFFVGDMSIDMEAAKAAGCKSILVKTHYNTEVRGDYVLASLAKTEDFIKILT